MKKAHLLSTVAAALLLTVGTASAQMKEQSPPERAPAAQQKAPAEKVGPAMNAPKPAETTGQASPTQMSPGKNDAAKPGAAANSPSGKDAADIKAKSDANVAPNKAAADKAAPDKAAQGKPAPDKAAQDKSAADKPAAAPSTAQTDPSKSTTTTTTTGQGAAGAAKLSTEQRTKITTVFKTQKVERIEPAKLNVSISIGTRVPSTVRFYPIPQEVIVIYPEWRGYDYVMVGDKILVLMPGTHEIVAILDA